MDDDNYLTGFSDFADVAATPLAALGLIGKIVSVWHRAVGADIARVTTPTGLRDGVLRIRCDSSVWTSELMMMQAQLLPRINAELRLTEPVTAIKTWTGPAGTVAREPDEVAPEPIAPLGNITSDQEREIAAITQSLPAGPIRDSVERAARASARRRNS